MKLAENGRGIVVHMPRLVSVVKHRMIAAVLLKSFSTIVFCFVFFLPPPQESLQKSERQRVAEQKNFPPFWEMRQKPPADWHLPLNEGK